MRAIFLVLVLGLAAVAAAPKSPERIVGGSVTSIEQYPSAAAILLTWQGLLFSQFCGGSILNNRAILSAAHCFIFFPISDIRIRVGSTNKYNGGVVHSINRIILHPNYVDFGTMKYDNDVAILHTTAAFVFNDRVRPGSIAGLNYNLPDNAPVWAIGWGTTSWLGQSSEDLRHVQVWTVNQAICRSRFTQLPQPVVISESMLCTGWLDVGIRDQCNGDSGGPVYHNGVIVGICSWGEECAHPFYPGVNVRVSRFTDWILANA